MKPGRGVMKLIMCKLEFHVEKESAPFGDKLVYLGCLYCWILGEIEVFKCTLLRTGRTFCFQAIVW